MDITTELIAAWEGIKKPRGFVADISSKSEAVMEFYDVENYFSGLNWDKVNPEAKNIRYMCPLMWMNEYAAKYYSLSYLIFLVSPEAIHDQYNIAESTVSYFNDTEFSILPKLQSEQQNIAKKVISYYIKNGNT